MTTLSGIFARMLEEDERQPRELTEYQKGYLAAIKTALEILKQEQEVKKAIESVSILRPDELVDKQTK
jgi:hypothetical protein